MPRAAVPSQPNLPTFDASLAAGFVFEPLAQWAASQPDKLALVGRGVELTYSALERRTNQIALALTAKGIGRGDRVSFVLPRGHQAILLLIGILKTGAAYVPLDSESPLTRIKDCLEDAKPKLVVVEELRLVP